MSDPRDMLRECEHIEYLVNLSRDIIRVIDATLDAIDVARKFDTPPLLESMHMIFTGLRCLSPPSSLMDVADTESAKHAYLRLIISLWEILIWQLRREGGTDIRPQVYEILDKIQADLDPLFRKD